MLHISANRIQILKAVRFSCINQNHDSRLHRFRKLRPGLESALLKNTIHGFQTAGRHDYAPRTLRIHVANCSGKALTRVSGDLGFFDGLGADVGTVYLSIRENIRPGGEYAGSDRLEYDAFLEEQQAVWNPGKRGIRRFSFHIQSCLPMKRNSSPPNKVAVLKRPTTGTRRHLANLKLRFAKHASKQAVELAVAKKARVKPAPLSQVLPQASSPESRTRLPGT
ncbi:hypothetical protein [Paraburkholderia gardini]|uniref:hypothetical protein n=1 Tax=Paraburkholderia gardini TaxID=2823469 RepID=UPI001E32B105|nr:hypothetical protein [Paraburkholderia gardini]